MLVRQVRRQHDNLQFRITSQQLVSQLFKPLQPPSYQHKRFRTCPELQRECVSDSCRGPGYEDCAVISLTYGHLLYPPARLRVISIGKKLSHSTKIPIHSRAIAKDSDKVEAPAVADHGQSFHRTLSEELPTKGSSGERKLCSAGCSVSNRRIAMLR